MNSDLVQFPNGLSAMLDVEGVTWYKVWRPLSKAIESNERLELRLNVSGYEYDPETKVITVFGLLEKDGEVHLNKDNFRANMARFLRGTPEC